jgi:hypothetical protein
MEFLDINLTKDPSLLLHGYSESLLLADFTEFSGFKNPYKKSAKQENLSLIVNSIFRTGKRGWKTSQKLKSEKT